MGAVQSDLKASMVQASSRGVIIPPDNDEFWRTFWTRPETAEHVFETFTATDIRGMRDDPQAVENLKTLVLKTSLLLLKHRHTAYSLSEDNVTTGTEVLNCVRILTRMLPYVYESDALRQWEDACFWERQDIRELRKFASDIAEYFDDQESLGVQVVQALVELLFYTGFTLPWPDSDTQQGRKGTVSYGLWQSGIACDTTVVTSKEFECRRTEILQLLLTLESKSIYISPNEYIYSTVDSVRCIVQLSDKRRVQALLCSLLNTVIKYPTDSWLGFDPRNPQGDSTREVHVKTCLHFLLVNVLNRAPWDDSSREHNEFRLQFSYLHKPKHFQFLADGIFKILRRPLEPSTNVLSMGQKTVAWAPEMILLLWEALYTNRKYLHYVVESGRALDLMVLLVYYAKESQMEGVGRVCVFCLQTLSAEPAFGSLLNRRFEAHENLPASIQIRNFHGSYADYFIISILSLLEATGIESSFWSASLSATINNIAAEVVGLARATSSKLVQTVMRMSKPSYILANESNISLLTNLLEAVNTIIECHRRSHENENILYAIWRARDRYEALRELCLLDQEELKSLELPAVTSPRHSSDGPTNGQQATEKSRGKQASGSGIAVTHELAARLPSLPLHTPLTLISRLNEHVDSLPEAGELPSSPLTSRRSSFASVRPTTNRKLSEVLQPIREAGTTGIERSKPSIEVFQFQAMIAALYASYYWGLVVSQDVQRASDTGKGIWVGTNIKLFKIKAGQVQGPSIWSPKGAVDAVGESLMAGVKDLTLRARKGISGDTT